MRKEITFGTKARDKILDGARQVAEAVSGTLGPKGKAVLIDKGVNNFTLDGVTVAQSIEELKDKVKNMGLQMVKNVASSTNDEAGDGTTTASILIYRLLKEGAKGVEMGIDPIKMRQALEDGAKVILENLKTMSRPVEMKEDMKNVATISSRDAEMGKIIGEIYNKIGVDGIITTEENSEIGLDHEMVEGMEIEKGFLSRYFMTNIPREQAIVEDPLILTTTQAISQNVDIVTILQQVNTTDKKSIVIFADDVTGEALATIIANKLQGIIKTLVIKTPGFGESKKAYLEDICALTGATFISEEVGKRVEDATMEDLGKAKRVIAYKDRAYIIGGGGKKKAIDTRIEFIKQQLNRETASYKKAVLEKRYARLKGGVAIIKVGAMTEEESREKQYRIEDAVNATKSALQEGVVIGGGLAFYKSAMALGMAIDKEKDVDYRYGLQILKNAIQKPAETVLTNAGLKADVILEEVMRMGPHDGYDANLEQYVPMFKHGIIDPLKVVRVALQQSVSIAGLFLITNCVVTDVPKEDQEKRPAQLNQ